jgi:hypothetical protein
LQLLHRPPYKPGIANEVPGNEFLPMKRAALALILFLIVFNFQSPMCFAQGSLTPPGPPSPSMKTLDQVEARTPVDAGHTPGDSIYLYIISQPGSYYLTTNIFGVSGQAGIEITANNVVLDLNGFSLLGTTNCRDGLLIFNPAQTNIIVRNGIISGWLNNYNGIESNGKEVIFEHLVVSGNTAGIITAGGTIVRNCLVSSNALFGVEVRDSGCSVIDSQFIGNNTLNIGGNIASIMVQGFQHRIENNHISASGSGGYGIYVFNTAGTSNNLVVRNFAAGGGPNNYSFNSSNAIFGPLVTNTVSGVITNSNPWANFSF